MNRLQYNNYFLNQDNILNILNILFFINNIKEFVINMIYNNDKCFDK